MKNIKKILEQMPRNSGKINSKKLIFKILAILIWDVEDTQIS